VDIRWWIGAQVRRDLRATSPSGLGCLNFHHQTMQQCLLDRAMEVGCDVRRPAEAVGVMTGPEPIVVVRAGQSERRVSARLVVGADGRNSRIRVWSGMVAARDPPCLMIAGALFEGMAIPEDEIRVTRTPGVAETSRVFPLGGKRFRVYIVFRHGTRRPLSGSESASEFMASCIGTGAPTDWFADATLAGPIASFHGAESWIE
jgi:2-polyprenyl-6-methoxyphenol hydroxylase-like FAD-dependent oxidoreductase